ncbi:MAG TPA: GNAT family N-acetyltransferase [Steroidobacteraceae bacterium]|nr:GNAT family N-acetyltransferase [Steroidobacteraceae bacterium]
MRPATPDDRVPWRLLLSADGPRAEVGKYLSRGELWLAERDSEVVGEMVLLQTRADVWEIMNLAVSRALHRHGIGTSLLRKARAVARQRGARRLEVGTSSSGIGQLAFYQRFGFRIVGVDTDFFAGRWRTIVRENGIPVRDMVRMAIAFDT